jgi:hypothetical protein
LTTALKEDDVNMFGDIQSDNEDDYVMPVYNENAAFEESPDQAEPEDEKFEETPQVMKNGITSFLQVE